jgi:V8-like Glu-specific endopeptidase
MKLKSIAAMSALLLGAAAMASPAFAQTVGAPGKGSGADVTRAAPQSLPDAKPKPLPKVDPEAASRGAPDTDAAIESYTTVTLEKDGSTSEQPASDSVRAILSEAAPSATGTVAGVVVGKDDRKQITDSTVYPYSTINWMFGQDQKGDWYTCSAALIGPKTVLTAAHCVFDHDTGGWAQQLIFIPGALDAENAPFGTYDWDSVHILKGFIDNYDGSNYGSVMPWDMAVITLTEAAGDQLGWMGFEVDAPGNWNATMDGYPADKPEGTMWESKCALKADNYAGLQGAEGLLFWHTCDMYSGSSGSSIYDLTTEGPYVRGVNVAEDGTRNYATTINEANFDWIAGFYQ